MRITSCRDERSRRESRVEVENVSRSAGRQSDLECTSPASRRAQWKALSSKTENLFRGRRQLLRTARNYQKLFTPRFNTPRLVPARSSCPRCVAQITRALKTTFLGRATTRCGVFRFLSRLRPLELRTRGLKNRSDRWRSSITPRQR